MRTIIPFIYLGLLICGNGCRIVPYAVIFNHTGDNIFVDMNHVHRAMPNGTRTIFDYSPASGFGSEDTFSIEHNNTIWVYAKIYPPAGMPSLGRQYYYLQVEPDGTIYRLHSD